MKVIKKQAAKVVASTDLKEFEDELTKVLQDTSIDVNDVDYSCIADEDDKQVYYSALIIYTYTEPAQD